MFKCDGTPDCGAVETHPREIGQASMFLRPKGRRPQIVSKPGQIEERVFNWKTIRHRIFAIHLLS